MHIIVFRTCPSFVMGKNLFYGTHEIIENEINKRQYPINAKRKGYCTPHASEWHIIEYRIKKEIAPAFLRDMGCTVINPENNDMTLINLLSRVKYGNKVHVDRAVGDTFSVLMFLLRYFYKLTRFFGTTFALIRAVACASRYVIRGNEMGYDVDYTRLNRLNGAKVLLSRMIKRAFEDKYHFPFKPVPNPLPRDGANKITEYWHYSFALCSIEDEINEMGELL